MSSIDINYDRFRPKACAFYAGRAWYSGVPSGEKLGWVLFSQVLDDIGNIEKCHQQNDPTSETFSDLQDSDGGVLQIPDAGEIVALVPLSKALFVFGSNGVWQIIGGDSGFTAASYMVEKVSGVGCLFQKAIVPVEDNIFYWSTSGIYLLQTDGSTATAKVSNISDKSIKTLYQSIPTINKVYSTGEYNESSKIIHWLYSDEDNLDTSNGAYKKNRVLALDLQLNAFYTYTLDNTVGPLIVGLISTKETVENTLEFDVVVNSDNIISNTDEVVVDIPVINGSIKQFKYLTITPSATTYSTTFSDMLSSGFSDWVSHNNVGNEIDSFLVTGYNMGGAGPARAKTAQYVHMFLQRTETGLDEDALPINPGGCLMQTRWDFTDDSGAGKWSQDVQVYRQPRQWYGEPNMTFNDGYPLVISKNKIRGRGKALQIKLSAEEGKDMVVVGWSMGFVSNENV